MAKTKLPPGYFDEREYTYVHNRFLARGCALCDTDKARFVCANCSAGYEAQLLEELIAEIDDLDCGTVEAVTRHLRDRLHALKQRSESPQSTNAVDPVDGIVEK